MHPTVLPSQLATGHDRTGQRYRAFLFALCFISSALGGTVSTLMAVYLPVVIKDLQAGASLSAANDISGYINALFIFGWAFGGFSWGLISDKIGRKKALLLAIAFYGLFTVATGLAPTWGTVVVCRFLSGFGVGGVLVVTFTLLNEVWPARTRAIYTGILSIAFPVGIFSAGLLNYAVASWRIGFFIGLGPLVLAFLGIWFVRESDKWLAYRQENHQAAAPLATLFSAPHRASLLLGSLTFGTMLIGLWAIFSWLPTWVQSLIATDAPQERGLSMMFLGMGGLSGGFLSGWLIRFLGLRQSLLLCFAVCSGMSFVLFKTNLVFSPVIYPEIIVLALFFGLSQGVLSVYIPQLFPTGIRATATGFCFNIGRLFTATAVLLVGILVASLGGYGNAIFLFSLVFLVGWLVVLFLHDKRENTPETIQ
ncbi:MFS transporter [Adhaeribacter pallidiroseus]|uniref:Gentisate transporter n=1 Tax=Adhaeribacter pallidiroseus TaxID=2072847 RepID=A0A369QEU6_9BACT|nr:MFS transporter [Adhaeribacter pallidiroseus]RDC63441.1 Gentisate transporter [Adhaeribacter pallidiroseus]